MLWNSCPDVFVLQICNSIPIRQHPPFCSPRGPSPDVWWGPGKPWGHLSAESPEGGPGAGHCLPASDSMGSANRVGAIWETPAGAWHQAADLPSRFSRSCSPSQQLLEHTRDFPSMLETVTPYWGWNIVGRVFLLHKITLRILAAPISSAPAGAGCFADDLINIMSFTSQQPWEPRPTLPF